MRTSFPYLMGAALTAATLLATPAFAGPQDSPLPTEAAVSDEARDAGITQEGEGYMGWSTASETPAPQLRSLASPHTAAPTAVPTPPLVEGIDVSGHQGEVDWSSQWALGKRFAYIKATEGAGFRNEHFNQQYNGSYAQGFIRGAYHFARPDLNNGKDEAEFFVRNGGGWSADGKTLPGVLDIEPSYIKGGDRCWGLKPAELTDWVGEFLSTYQNLTGREATIYTNNLWWRDCTGNSTRFSSSNPLWIAHWTDILGPLPGEWQHHTVWQYSDKPIDQNRFNGTMAQLKNFASKKGVYTPDLTYFGPDTVRISGKNRFVTSTELSRNAFEPGVETVFIASADEFPDALSAGPAAGQLQAPLLLAKRKAIPSTVQQELARLKPRSITILGGEAAISQSVAKELEGFTDGDVSRWHGKNRYETAVAIAAATHPKGARTVYIASGADFPDGLAGGPAAAVEGAPLLLTTPKRLTRATQVALENLGPEQIVVLGGESAISASVLNRLDKIAPATRIGGSNRFETAALVSKRAFKRGASTAIVTNGMRFPDALTGGALGAQLPGPILLGREDTVPSTSRTELKRLEPDQLIILGGEEVVSKNAVKVIERIWH